MQEMTTETVLKTYHRYVHDGNACYIEVRAGRGRSSFVKRGNGVLHVCQMVSFFP